ncbi:MAG: YceI family protein [Flavobacteriia bacterium]|nr:YceI family protein [Flavobacteriia bacterium]
MALVFALIFSAFTLQSFTSSDNVKVKNSSIEWKGEKVVGSHEGTIALKSSELIFKNNTLKGGSFVIDMTTIACTDLTGEYKGKLEGHLKSDDFFSVSHFPTSKLVISKVSKSSKDSYKVSAKLTVKGITKNIDFVAQIKGNKLSATILVDRTQFDVKYGSGSFFQNLGDNMIYDEFEIKVNLEI